MNIAALFDVTPCSLVIFPSLKTEAVSSSEMPENFYHPTCCHNQRDGHLCSRRLLSSGHMEADVPQKFHTENRRRNFLREVSVHLSVYTAS
jgi:hypothetical protein